MGILRSIWHFILYSNLWISLGAVAMTARTFHFLNEPLWQPGTYLFSFSATLFIYAGHRVIGLSKSTAFTNKGRYKIIARYRSHIVIYAIIGAVGTAVSAFWLPWRVLAWMVLPGLVSLGYILPAFAGKKRKRLRDFDFIKIFLVAGVWAWVTVALPAFTVSALPPARAFCLLVEVAFFVFAITLPFDIRDLKVDGSNAVRTLPARYGILFSKRLALFCLLVSFVFSILSQQPIGMLAGTLAAYAPTTYLIWHAQPDRPDYYYTAFLDGTLVMLPIFSILSTFVI